MDALDQAVGILASLHFGEDDEEQQPVREELPKLEDVDYDALGDPREKLY